MRAILLQVVSSLDAVKLPFPGKCGSHDHKITSENQVHFTEISLRINLEYTFCSEGMCMILYNLKT